MKRMRDEVSGAAPIETERTGKFDMQKIFQAPDVSDTVSIVFSVNIPLIGGNSQSLHFEELVELHTGGALRQLPIKSFALPASPPLHPRQLQTLV